MPATEKPDESTPSVVLASTSRYRAALLRRLGISFTCIAPEVDEDAWKQHGLPPQKLAEVLANVKSDDVLQRIARNNAIVIGSDQVCALDEQVLDKPGSHDAAVDQLLRLSGREHQLITAVSLRHGMQTRLHTDITRLQMRVLTRKEIERYVAADEPWDCAGSYKLEERGICLFERIESSDHSAITGLPLIALTTLLRECGIAVP